MDQITSNRKGSVSSYSFDSATSSIDENGSDTQSLSGKGSLSRTLSFVRSPIAQARKIIPKTAFQVSSFVVSLLSSQDAEEARDLMPFTVADTKPGTTIVCSSPETLRITASGMLSLDPPINELHPSSSQEATLPQQGFFQGGDQDHDKLVTELTQKLQKAQSSQDPEGQLKKDILRTSYFLNGKKAEDVETLRAFFGKAADSILPILNQTIPNTACDVVTERIIKAAPLDTTHVELAANNREKSGTSISVSKKEGSSNFYIEVESKGDSNVFLKKVEREGTPDFEVIALSPEVDDATPGKLSGEGRQVVVLELKPNANGYSMSCSKLMREYQIKTAV